MKSGLIARAFWQQLAAHDIRHRREDGVLSTSVQDPALGQELVERASRSVQLAHIVPFDELPRNR